MGDHWRAINRRVRLQEAADGDVLAAGTEESQHVQREVAELERVACPGGGPQKRRGSADVRQEADRVCQIGGRVEAGAAAEVNALHRSWCARLLSARRGRWRLGRQGRRV